MFSWFAKATTASITSFLAPYIIRAITDGVANVIDPKTTIAGAITALVTGGLTYLVRNSPR